MTTTRKNTQHMCSLRASFSVPLLFVTRATLQMFETDLKPSSDAAEGEQTSDVAKSERDAAAAALDAEVEKSPFASSEAVPSAEASSASGKNDFHAVMCASLHYSTGKMAHNTH